MVTLDEDVFTPPAYETYSEGEDVTKAGGRGSPRAPWRHPHGALFLALIASDNLTKEILPSDNLKIFVVQYRKF